MPRRHPDVTDVNIADIALAASFRSDMSRFRRGRRDRRAGTLDDDEAVRDEMAVRRK
jgi:hypothetical protein